MSHYPCNNEGVSDHIRDKDNCSDTRYPVIISLCFTITETTQRVFPNTKNFFHTQYISNPFGFFIASCSLSERLLITLYSPVLGSTPVVTPAFVRTFTNLFPSLIFSFFLVLSSTTSLTAAPTPAAARRHCSNQSCCHRQQRR